MSDEKKARLLACQAGNREAFFAITGSPGTSAKENAKSVYDQIGAELAVRGMEIFHERIFGTVSAYDDVIGERRTALESKGIDALTPLTYIQGTPPWGEGLAGVIVHAVSTGEG
jgi:hypothetical protein